MSYLRLRAFSKCVIAGSLCIACANSKLPPVPTASGGSRLAYAEALIALGSADIIDNQRAAVYQLRAAEIAWNELDTDGGTIRDINALPGNQRRALAILTAATEEVAGNFVGSKYLPEKQFSDGGYTYQVAAELAQKPGIFPLAGLETAKPSRQVKHRLCVNWHVENGAGVPCAPKWKRPPAAEMHRFVTNRGYLEPITAVMTFGPKTSPDGHRRVSITGYDPTYISKVKLGQTEYPLAADFTAPIVEQTNDINEVKVALTGLVHPGHIDSKLIMLEPYDPQRIPVLLVHGLNSHPRMWRDVLNDLRADPQLRGKYQYMLFYYPTGWPIAYSSMRLREELSAWEAAVGTPKKMVLIGHSMGGLLSRMQVIAPGRTLWDAQWSRRADHLFGLLASENLVKRMLLFQANPGIGREIYICTPHRGSKLADLSLTSLLIRVFRLPSTITKAFIDLPGNLAERGQLTSVANLSPSNPLYNALAELPIPIPHHSIIGNHGRGPDSSSSDGVVPYWSSHLESAESELVVPDNHGAYDDPRAIAEMRRILLKNAEISPAR